MLNYPRMASVVNGMSQARRFGHGQVTAFLERAGMARSTAYRWKSQLAWWLEEGPAAFARMSAQVEELLAAGACSVAEGWPAGLGDPKMERRFILEAAMAGNSNANVAHLLAVGGGRQLDPKTIERSLREAGSAARRVFGQYFAGTGRVGAGDETFLPNPLLLMVEPLSLLISGLRLANGRAAEDWQPVFAAMKDLARVVSDRGRGIVRAAKEAGVAGGADQWHLLHPARQWMASLERTCWRSIEAEYEALAALEAKREHGSGKAVPRAQRAYAKAQQACEAALGEFDRLGPLLAKVTEAFDYVSPDGRLNTAPQARQRVDEALAEMVHSEKGQRLAAKLSGLRDPLAFTHLDALALGLRHLGLEQVGPDRGRRLARLVAEAQAWRSNHKGSLDELAKAATTLAAQVKVDVIGAFDLACRSSSYVECVNGRVQLAKVSRKRVSEDFLYLVAVHHNMAPFGRGSVRAGLSPARLAGVVLPTDDWIELLDLTAQDQKGHAAPAA